jgi:hypothetical protein
VPEDLAESFAIGNAELYREGRLIEQAALAEFIEERTPDHPPAAGPKHLSGTP